MAGRMVITDHGYQRIMGALKRGTTPTHLVVGWTGPEAEQAHDENAPKTVAEIAAIVEFGTKDGKIPARSALGATVEANRETYDRLIHQAAEDDIALVRPMDKGLDRLGLRIVADVIKRINAGIEPPLAQSTIDRKGSSKPWVDTGRVKAALTHEVRLG